MFYFEKGNWYIDENTFAEYGIFREGATKAFAMTKDPIIAEHLVQLLNEEHSGESWKGDIL